MLPDFVSHLRGWLGRPRSKSATQVPSARPTWQILAEEDQIAAPLPLTRMQRELAAAAELAYGLGEEARLFADLLDAQMAELADLPQLRMLMGATRTMILRAESAERLIRKCGDEVEALRGCLGPRAQPDEANPDVVRLVVPAATA